MTTDKTWFDERLKGNLYLDICLRTAIWFLIAYLTIAYASLELYFSPIGPFQRGYTSLLPVVVVDVMRVALVLCFLALLLKDLEFVAPNSWGQETTIGKIGGVIRKLAGDLSLWIIGALVTLLAFLIYFAIFAYTHNEWTQEIRNFSISVGLVLIIPTLLLSVVNVWVRRKTSLISSLNKLQATINAPWKVIVFYFFLLFITVSYK